LELAARSLARPKSTIHRLAVGAEQNIRRLEVAVHDALAVDGI